jgi:hypothetical protein
MEFKLNKIEMDVRQRLNEERSMDKVHNKKGIQVNKDKDSTKEEIEENSEKSKKAKDAGNEEKNEKKNNEHEVENKGVDPDRGHFIDIKR